MSGSAIADALVTMLSATSVLGSGNVSKSSYQVLEIASTCSAVVQWTRLRTEQNTFGGSHKRIWDMDIHAFIRDTNDPVAAVNNVWSITDKIVACLDADPTLLGTCVDTGLLNGNRDPEQAYVVSGATWLPFHITLETQEY